MKTELDDSTDFNLLVHSLWCQGIKGEDPVRFLLGIGIILLGKVSGMDSRTHTLNPLKDFWRYSKKCRGTLCLGRPASTNLRCSPNLACRVLMVQPTYKMPQGQVRQYTTNTDERLWKELTLKVLPL